MDTFDNLIEGTYVPETEAAPDAPAQTALVPLYDFAAPEHVITFPVPWPNKDGHIYVTHTLNRPTKGQLIEWKKKTVIEKQYNKDGGTVGESVESAAADQWLWDQIIKSFSGYPGAGGTIVALPQQKEKMRPTHKESAINYLLNCEAEILFEESAATFDSGSWVVQLKIGPKIDEPIAVIKFKLREWNQRERNNFEKRGAISRSDNEGKLRIGRYSLNLETTSDLFDALLLDCEGGVVDGRTLSEIGRDEFARAVNAEFKTAVVSELTNFWRRTLSDLR